MEGNFEEILKKEYDKASEEIRRSIAKREDADAEFAALEVDDSMKREFHEMLCARDAAVRSDEELLAQMSEEGQEAYRLGQELLARRAKETVEFADELTFDDMLKGDSAAENSDLPDKGEVVPLDGVDDGGDDGGHVVRIHGKRMYLVVALVAVCAMAFGMTAFGGKNYVMDLINKVLPGKEQMTMNSKEEEREYSDRKDNEVYVQINKELGIDTVETVYLPKDYILEEVNISSDKDRAYISYSNDKDGWIQYHMYVNQSDQSVSIYHDDIMVEENQMVVSDVLIDIAKYRDEENSVHYEASFIYKNVNYRLLSNMEQEEFEKILKNLFF